MKLISMTDFVLENQGKINNSELGLLACKYAKFLKKPLKLEMFFPCDKDGNVLEEPIYTTNHSDECYCKGCEEETKRCSDLQDQYRKAKEKVLFSGFDDIEAINYHISRNRNIEYLSKFGTLELTENAIKTFK